MTTDTGGQRGNPDLLGMVALLFRAGLHCGSIPTVIDSCAKGNGSKPSSRRHQKPKSASECWEHLPVCGRPKQFTGNKVP